MERRSAVGSQVGPDPAAVALHDPLDQGQPDPGALVVLAGMQSLEDREQLVGVAPLSATV